MKTKLIIEENVARLLVEAESEFEREMLKQVEKFNSHALTISTEQSFGRTLSGNLTVMFSTKAA